MEPGNQKVKLTTPRFMVPKREINCSTRKTLLGLISVLLIALSLRPPLLYEKLIKELLGEMGWLCLVGMNPGMVLGMASVVLKPQRLKLPAALPHKQGFVPNSCLVPWWPWLP